MALVSIEGGAPGVEGRRKASKQVRGEKGVHGDLRVLQQPGVVFETVAELQEQVGSDGHRVGAEEALDDR
ncbi:hypothetical protein MVLG_07325 [Microbotryum lychnidis-dioicae p1A1 Lamole]|uniref:Uncharacterized protein n=1 Tax=Microbotryum lychnidis-dioicae (strain p1A1 Lamole / MvSl-1064) TaxID=683840 RepID=U5HK02_USTV1|nr:hypothetical protein MVLG_07325 [Microbotryum lychnidis-dioicae p1A1 Lamole]|eukprot:KDE02099.1 hypothetical protein MVLG_07325 [Microbotryum lychnidis-dioicae p1A1 Lamole]